MYPIGIKWGNSIALAIVPSWGELLFADCYVVQSYKKCRLVAKHPEIGDPRPEFGENLRSTYVGSYVIFFRRTDVFVDVVRVIRGDRDPQSL